MVSVAVPAMLAAKASKKSGQILQEQFGYNFIDLITKLVLFYLQLLRHLPPLQPV